ncbi:hypothetical protein [Micromonospora rubida]|uniref:hypothetical protein n=1 Tax=Micromonospora rubida TaxID=2697657 RepID=UPI001376C84B|nr:hypothetical protein [Micromonospora rubida]NBE85123.1 hypothetical protein [Micromonospora rubida]
MATSPSATLRRRRLLGLPALLAAAFTVTATARPAPARAAGQAECLADLLESS